MGHLWLFLMLNLLLISVDFSDQHDGIPEVAFPIPSLPVASAGTRNSFDKATSGIPSGFDMLLYSLFARCVCAVLVLRGGTQTANL